MMVGLFKSILFIATFSVVVLLPVNVYISNSCINKDSHHDFEVKGKTFGHWEYDKNAKLPYSYSPEVCNSSYINVADCKKTDDFCPSTLMNWIYKDRDDISYPKFHVYGFRRSMMNTRLLFLGSSLVRQQVQALVWTLGHDKVEWNETLANCISPRWCMHDVRSNITICHQFMGVIAKKVYHEGSYIIDHPKLHGNASSSCILHDDMIDEIAQFDLVFVQGSVAWYTNLPLNLNSTSSPLEWVTKMLPVIYYDAMEALLSKISQRTKTVWSMEHAGLGCKNRTVPEPFDVINIPDSYGWSLAPMLWDPSLTLVQKNNLNVQLIDAREPLMQSVHAHPNSGGLNPDNDCLHFCMNSAAVNIYLDMYWTEVFSTYVVNETAVLDRP